MVTETIVAGARTEEELDRTFDALSHSHRREVVRELERDAPLLLSDLAKRLAERDDSISTKTAKLELAHRHLPRLDDAGVVAYDSATRSCELDRAVTARAILAAIDAWT